MSERRFDLRSPFAPTGDQPEAIAALARGIEEGRRHLVLLGATGTGKTFTMANVIARTGRPTLLISHNKTLAAQLYEEMRELFPANAVSYFVSYYDYYQPEAYIPQRDIYIEKDASRNPDLDRLRLAATSNLLSRPDTIVVASVSCLFGLGSPTEYGSKTMMIARGDRIDRRRFLLGLSDMQYVRAEVALERGRFRVRGDVIEIAPASEQYGIRVELFGDEVEAIQLFDILTGEVLADETKVFVFPAVHYVMPEEQKAAALEAIREELDARVLELRSHGRLLEAQRLLARTRHDLEMLEEVGYCSGIENYSRFFDGRPRGARPYTLLDYFRHVPGRGPDDWLVIIDESHVTIPQVRGMYHGDRARKQVLVDHGFRLPSALDNRPVTFEEFEAIVPQALYVSATPGPYELERAGGEVAEQVIRPTGLVDPPIDVRSARGQVPDLLAEVRLRAERGERSLVTALTKRLCEDLTNYLHDQGVRVRYLHSDIDTLERLTILRDLREGDFDVLVGVNLLREGLDLPEVSLVCILDADKQGFLRSQSSLIQTMGRAARNANGAAILYADAMTPEMRSAIDEVERRRAKQLAYNAAHGITPETIRKAIRRGIETELAARRTARAAAGRTSQKLYERDELVRLLEQEMVEASQRLEFEKAARLRDRLNDVRTMPEFADAEGTTPLKLPLEDEGDGGARRGSKKQSPAKPGAARSKAGITRGRKRAQP
ncbi:MAG TPA: excinuclease ABC subunit UvrB [Phycisphaerales bacterium]|nr:excinuclease ABC subunit UvrB [Phycisphaerales bacterium]HMP38430.1 excinuclease ABC subunit UvrB [Phycisphaerales bacterium]